MPVRRTHGTFPVGGTVTLPGLPGRQAFRFQNGDTAASVTYNSGFTVNVAAGGVEKCSLKSGAPSEQLQGAIVLTGTSTKAYDAEETYS